MTSLRTLLSAIVLVVLSCLSAPTFAQSLAIADPAAGAEVGETFKVEVTGPPRATVALLVAGEELARFMLDANGRGQATLAAPATDKFVLEARQLDGEDSVALISIKLRVSQVPPPPVVADEASNDAENETTAPAGPAVDSAADELPPPPPPPDLEPINGSDVTEPAPGAPASDAPPEPDAPDAVQDSADVSSYDSGASQRLGGDVDVVVLEPRSGDRIGRIFIEGLAAFFAVPTAWIIGAIAVGVFTDFGNDVEEELAYGFALSGIAGSTLSVYLTGELMDGNGSFVATLIGATLVTALTMLSFQSDQDGFNDPDGTLLVGAIFGSLAGIAGAVAGYELTSDTSADYTQSTGVSDAVIGVLPAPGGGAMFGVSGRF